MKILRTGVLLLVATAAGWGQPPDASYTRGKNLLDSHEWNKAIDQFDRVISQRGLRVDASLYWKAYSLNKLAQREQALNALLSLRASYPTSNWLQDAAALEMQIKHGLGQNAAAESQSDDELKLLALNGLARTDPDRAIPAVENLLKEVQAPALKREALFVVAQSGSKEAQDLLVRVAKGGIDPELQLLAVQYLADRRSYQGDLGQLLEDIFHSTSDQDVQWAVVTALSQLGDRARATRLIAEVPGLNANTEYRQLLALSAAMGGLTNRLQETKANQAVLDYRSVTDRTAKEGIIEAHSTEAAVLIALAKIETDSLLRRRIIGHLIELNTPETREYLLSVLK